MTSYFKNLKILWIHFNRTSLVAQPVKNLPDNAGGIRDMCSNPGSGISPGRRNGNPLQCSFLGNRMDRKTRWTIVHGSQRIGHN